MARALFPSAAAAAAVLIFACGLRSQYGAGRAVGGQGAQAATSAAAPAPSRDLQGVWMPRTPAGVS